MMTTRNTMKTIILICMFGYTTPTSEGLSLPSLLLLRQIVLGQGQARLDVPQPTWGEWTLWSVCTASTEQGMRVRSRTCENGPCDKLPGLNYEVMSCQPEVETPKMQNKTYLEKCKSDPSMNNTLSCRLYRENPVMAFDIFRSARCLFNVMGDIGELGEIPVNNPGQHLILARSANVRAGETGLEFFEESDRPGSTSEAKFGDKDQSDPSTTRSTYNTETNQLCIDVCEKTIIEASKVRRLLGENSPSTVRALLQVVRSTPLIKNNGASILKEYNNCLTECRTSGAGNGAMRTTLVDASFDPTAQNPDIVVSLISPDQRTGGVRQRRSVFPNSTIPHRSTFNSSLHYDMHRYLQRKGMPPSRSRIIIRDLLRANWPNVDPEVLNAFRRLSQNLSDSLSPEQEDDIFAWMTNITSEDHKGGNWTTLPTSTPPAPTINTTVLSTNTTGSSINTTVSSSSRHKRDAFPYRSSQFESPCFESVDESSNPRVYNLDNSDGELFFYEGRQQRFTRRKCMGRLLVPGLFQPQEVVLQQRTKQLALCKQGYLTRYGLLIQLDPKGEFAFNDGERFSVTFRPFKLESHCSLSTLL